MAKISALWIKKDEQQFTVNEQQELQLKYDEVNFKIDSANGLSLNELGVKLSHIDFGTTSPSQIDAADIPLNDTNNLFSIDNVESALSQVASKMILYRHTIPAFNNLTPVATNGEYISTVLDPLIKSISGHNNGQGSSDTPGVVLDTTRPYQIPLRDHQTQAPIDDGEGHEVYARLTFDPDSETYLVTYYYMDDTGEHYYTGFTTDNRIDFAYVYFSQKFINLPWASVFIDSSWQDVAGIESNIKDDNVDVDGMQYLLAGATTQAQVNSILDLLGDRDTAHGAKLIKYMSSSSITVNYEDVAGALDGIFNLIGSGSLADVDFTENNVLADNTSIIEALDTLDKQWGKLASTNFNEGASLVGIYDAQNLFTATTVEDALQELSLGKRNLKTAYLSLSSDDISNGYKALSFKCYGTVVNNIVRPNFAILNNVLGGVALDTEFCIMRDDSGTTDYIVWKNNITPPGCTYSSSGIDSTDFGDLLIAGDVLRLGVTV